MLMFTVQMVSRKSWHAIYRTAARNGNRAVAERRVALFFRLIGPSMNGQTTSKPVRLSANGKAI